MDNRQALFYCPPGLQGRLPRPDLPGWQLHPVNAPADAARLASRHGAAVGLAVLAPEYLDPALHTALFQAADLRWIALMPPGAESHAGIAALVREHCHDFHSLPVDGLRLRHALGHAAGMAGLPCPTETALSPSEFGMCGNSPAMRAFFNELRKVARAAAPVLLTGESGTGKEMAARALHRLSDRHQGPFVAVNCGALAASLVQSELFGHEKGAFTGAMARKIGRIEAAAGGTIFLDEIGDLPLELQVNLLRFLQEKTIERVGGHATLPVDTRVIAATHVDLEAAVAAGAFRQDLYYRLNVLHLALPPLRERLADIEPLARHFFLQHRDEGHARLRGFSAAALDAMARHVWPGNVREMVNRVRRAIVMCERRLITPADLGLADARPVSDLSLEDARNRAEREVLVTALARTRDNIQQAAQLLGVSRVTLYRLLRKHGLAAD